MTLATYNKLLGGSGSVKGKHVGCRIYKYEFELSRMPVTV